VYSIYRNFSNVLGLNAENKGVMLSQEIILLLPEDEKEYPRQVIHGKGTWDYPALVFLDLDPVSTRRARERGDSSNYVLKPVEFINLFNEDAKKIVDFVKTKEPNTLYIKEIS
jgi:hypothetical protein